MLDLEKLKNQKYGKLTIINAWRDDKKKIRCLCKCDCGNQITTRYDSIISGYTRSCRCAIKSSHPKKDRSSVIGKRFGSLIVVDLSDKTTKRGNRIYSLLKCKCDCGNICYVEYNNLILGQTKSCGCLQKEQIKKNLSKTKSYIDKVKQCGTHIDTFKKTKPNRNNLSTKVRGVSWHNEKRKYIAYITYKKKRYRLGYFESLQDAKNIRRIAQEKALNGTIDTWYNQIYKKGANRND